MYVHKSYETHTQQSELRVTDWFYQDIGFASNICCNWIAIAIIHYKNTLQFIADNTVKSGKTHDALLEYVSGFDKLIEMVKGIGEKYRFLCDSFVCDIDDWDQFVYQKGENARVVRDFSNKKLQSIINFLSETPPGGIDLATDAVYWVLSTAVRGAGEIGAFLDNSKRCYSLYISSLANLNKCNADELRGIFERVKTCDVRYSVKFGILYDELKSVYNILSFFNDIMERKILSDPHSIASFKNKLSVLSEEEKKINTEIGMSENISLTADSVNGFVSDMSNEYVFINYSSDLNEFAYNIGASDVFFMSMMQGDKIVTTNYATLSIPSDVPESKRYEYVMIKKQLAEIIENMADSDIEVSAESYETARKIFSGFGKTKNYVSDYDEYKDVCDMLYDWASDTADSLEIGVDVSEIIVSMFANYLENEKIIASLAVGHNSNSLFSIAVKQLQLEYKDAFIKGKNELFDYASIKIANEVIKEGSKNFLKFSGKSAGSLYSLTKFGIKVFGEISGVTDDVNSKLEFCTLFNSIGDIEQAYQKNFVNVARGNTESQDLLNLENSFEVLKRTYSKLYNLMGESFGAKGDINKQAYYQYVGREIDKSSISTGIRATVSYDDFLNNKINI